MAACWRAPSATSTTSRRPATTTRSCSTTPRCWRGPSARGCPRSVDRHHADLRADRQERRAHVDVGDADLGEPGGADHRLEIAVGVAALEEPPPRALDQALQPADEAAPRR